MRNLNKIVSLITFICLPTMIMGLNQFFFNNEAYETELTLLDNSPWNKLWGDTENDFCYDIALDSENNMYLAGHTQSFGALGMDVCIVKLNQTRDYQWHRLWGGINDDFCTAITIDTNDNIYLAGYSNSFSSTNNLCVVKFDKNGEQVANLTWGGTDNDYSEEIILDESQSIYLAGHTKSFGAEGDDALLVKFNNSFEYQWHQLWGGNDDDNGYSIDIDDSMNIYLAGSTESFGTQQTEMFIARYNDLGQLQWNTTWGTPDGDYAKDIKVSQNSLYLAGYICSFSATGDDACLVKLDSSGNLIWYDRWGGAGNEFHQRLAIGPSNSLYVTGHTTSYGEGLYDMYLIKYDDNGNQIWLETFGSSGTEYGRTVLVSSNDIYIAGTTNGLSAAGTDMLLVRFTESTESLIDGFLIGILSIVTLIGTVFLILLARKQFIVK